MSVINFNQNSELNYSLALKKIQEQDYLFAIRLLKDAIRIDKFPKYYVELAELYYKLGQFDESTATYVELSNQIITMEIALGALHSHQTSLGVELNPDNLTISSGCFFLISRKHIDNEHLNRVLRIYQKVALDEEQPKIINLRENAILRKLKEAKELGIRGDYSKAMIILDKIEDKKYLDKVLELKTIIYFGAEDYEKAITVGMQYNAIHKGNPTIARSILYGIYAINNRMITPKFRNAFNDFENEIFQYGKPESIIGLYELAEMVGYKAGASKLIKKMIKAYPYDLAINLTAIAFYGVHNNLKEVDKLLKRANELFSYSPSLAFYNCLRNEISKETISSEAWYSLVDENISCQYVRIFVLNYLKKLMLEKNLYDAEVLKSAITFFDKDKLKELLTVKEIVGLPEYKNLLIWGIENPYLGIDTKILLIEIFISKYANTDKIFIIPTELGITCLKLSGYVTDVLEVTENSIYNAVYANVIFTEHDFDKKVLLNAVHSLSVLINEVEKDLLCATVHYFYYKLKKYEPQLELIAGAYQVSLDELKIIIENIKF